MINTSPSLIIFINPEIVDQIKAVFTRQMYLNEIIDGTTFDNRVSLNPNYPSIVHSDGYRIMVMRDLHDHTNRNLADIVLYAKNGMVSVLSNKYGPPNITLPIDRAYLSALINLQKPIPQPELVPDLDDGFVGEFDNDDFDRRHLDPDRKIEPV